MDVGIGLFTCQRRPGDDRSMAEIYDEMLTLARTADEAGLASAWVSEHHFVDDGYLSATMPSLGAIAGVTNDIEIGTCIALAPLYDSVRLAEDAATVELLSSGRMTVGLSIGYRDPEFEGFGVPQAERVARTEDAVRVLRGAWSEGPLGYDPEFHPVGPDRTVTPKPASPPPVVLGGKAQPAVRRAARLGDGWIAPSSLSIDGIRTRLDDIERARAGEPGEAGGPGESPDDGFRTYVLQHGFVAGSREAAWNRMEGGYRYMLRKYAAWARGEPVAELDREQLEAAKERAIFGTPSEVAGQLAKYREALGDDVHFVFRCYQPGVGTDAMADCIERLGEDVLPDL